MSPKLQIELDVNAVDALLANVNAQIEGTQKALSKLEVERIKALAKLEGLRQALSYFVADQPVNTATAATHESELNTPAPTQELSFRQRVKNAYRTFPGKFTLAQLRNMMGLTSSEAGGIYNVLREAVEKGELKKMGVGVYKHLPTNSAMQPLTLNGAGANAILPNTPAMAGNDARRGISD